MGRIHRRAIKKARTAVFFMMPTGEVGKLSQPGKPLYGIEISNDGLITFPGGLPIVDENGVLVGGIGVSGSTVEDDDAVARARSQNSRRNGDPRTSLADVVSPERQSVARRPQCNAPPLVSGICRRTNACGSARKHKTASIQNVSM